jgi:hypothetical protein
MKMARAEIGPVKLAALRISGMLLAFIKPKKESVPGNGPII